MDAARTALPALLADVEALEWALEALVNTPTLAAWARARALLRGPAGA